MSLRLEFSGSPEVDASRNAVWQRLVDPQFLAASAPGVTSVEAIEPGRFDIAANLGIGPMTVPLRIAIEMFDLAAPERARLRAATGASGSAAAIVSDVRLVAIGEQRTRLAWTATVEVDGPLAAFGGGMVEGVARKLTEDFWLDFAHRVQAEELPTRQPS